MSGTVSADTTILIASSSLDIPTWGSVARNLTSRGYDVITYEADKVALGVTPLDLMIENDRGLVIQYDNRRIDTQNISAAWFRRSSFISNAQEDSASQLGLDMERRAIQSAIWDEIPDGAWINSPERIQTASKKISQLVLAEALGMSIPTTIVGNRWDSVHTHLPADVIYKSSYPVLFDGTGFKSLFTTPFKNTPSELPVTHNPFPGIWQPLLQKAREWRITIVGDEAFDAAIYTSSEAKDDWRRHQDIGSRVTFRKELFPDDIKRKCFNYLGTLGLGFGAFDFIEDDAGEITFLECNPNGQFKWLEDILDLPISQAVSDELASIALKAHR